MLDTILQSYAPYRNQLKSALEKVAAVELPQGCDFLWLTYSLTDFEGLPLKAYPCERNQQQHDGWAHEDEVLDVVPSTVVLPDRFFSTPSNCEEFSRHLFTFVQGIWAEIGASRLAYFSDWDDGTYVSLLDGQSVSAWDIESVVASPVK